MRICFFIWGLRAAGAERVLTTLSNAWAEKGWTITILTLEDGSRPPFYALHPSIEVRPLDLEKDSSGLVSGLLNNIRRVRTIRRAIREAAPDAMISFVDGVNVLAVAATRGLGIPLVISERTDPSRRSMGRAWRALRDWAYPRADAVVFQSKGVMDWFPERVRSRGVVIPNPVVVPPADPAPPPRPGGPPVVLSLARLDRVKGFDILLEAFAEANQREPGWRLEIWGTGHLVFELQRQAAELGLADCVRFPGVTQKPFEVLRRGDLFVLPSRAEGFPNALVEAMACGLPVVSTNFGGAAREIVNDGVNGLLVPPENPSALAEALVRLMRDPEARARLAEKAPAVAERYTLQRVLGAWEETLDLAARRKSGRSALGGDPCRT